MSEHHNDIYEKLGELLGEVKGMRETFGSEMRATNKHLKELNGSVVRHNQEIRELQSWKDTLMGKIAGVGLVLAFVWEIIRDKVSNFL